MYISMTYGYDKKTKENILLYHNKIKHSYTFIQYATILQIIPNTGPVYIASNFQSFCVSD